MGEKSARAVVVEDDADIRGLLEMVLVQMGYDVTAVDTGEAGVEKVRDLVPDLVTLDVGLPGMDGLATLSRIREFHTGAVVMVTARAQEVVAEQALAAGADGYLVKPFRPRSLREDLQRVLDR